MRPRRARWILPVTLLLLLWVAGNAGAHGYQTFGNPAPYAVVPEPPLTVTLYFSEPTEPQFSRVSVLDASGRNWAITEAYAPEGNRSRLAVDVGLPGNGTYTVVWEAHWVSDGHSTDGRYGFAVGDPENADFTGLDPDQGGDVLPEWREVALRAVLFASTLAAVGAIAFVAFVNRPGLKRTRDRALGVGIASTHVLLGATFLHLLTQTATGFRVTALEALTYLDRAVASTYLARVLALRILLGLVLLAGFVLMLNVRRRGLLAATGVVALLLVPTFSLLSHAASVPSARTLALAADASHLLAAAVWVGGLPLLVLALHEARTHGIPEAGGAVAHRFSRLALASLVLVTLTGAYTGFVHLHGDAGNLTGTLYGRLLLLKIGLVAGVVALAAYNRYRVLPRLRRNPEAARAVGRVALAELLVAALVVVAAGGLTAASPEPPQAALPAPEPPRTVTLEGEGLAHNATLEVTPAKIGDNRFRATIHMLENGTRLDDAKRVTLVAQPDGRDLDAQRVPLEFEGNGTYTGNASLALGGAWSITLQIVPAEGPGDSIDYRLSVRP